MYLASGIPHVSYLPWRRMHACLAEIFNLRDKISQKTHLEKVFHIASSDNVADICTRRETSLSNLGPGSVWQSGPPWLSQPRYSWPCNRDFSFKDLPSKETKTPLHVVLAAKVTGSVSPSMVQFVMEQHWNYSKAIYILAKAIKKLYDVPEIPITHNSTRVRLGLNQHLSIYIF